MRHLGLCTLTGLLLGVIACPGASGNDPTPEITLDHDDLVITSNVKVKPGQYRIRDAKGDGVIQVTADHVTVDLSGVILEGSPAMADPDTFEGVGLSVVGARDVSIVGGSFARFRVGVRAERAPNLRLEGVRASGNRRQRLSSTPAKEDEADWLWPHENDEGQWERNYGAGFSLTGCPGAKVVGCFASQGQNGLLLSRCDGASVYESTFSFNSGWGIALWRTSGAAFEGNQADWCVRGYSDGVYARGQDSTGFLVFEQCSRNVFRRNSATHSGDGFFLYAGNETLKKTGTGGCNDNEVVDNDFSYAVANGIEATFSRGNKFLHNRCDGCDHGVWAGYSYETTIEGNRIHGCANGVSIEHGHANRIVKNSIEDCAVGVHLWWDDDKDLLASVYGKTQDTSSSKNVVEGNVIAGGKAPIRLDGDKESKVGENAVFNTVSPRVQGLPGADLLHPDDPVFSYAHRALGGRAAIAIDAWGPVDPWEPRLLPAQQQASGVATIRVFGAGAPFQVTQLPEGLVAEPASGTTPALVRVHAAPGGAGPSIRPFELRVRIEGPGPDGPDGSVLVARGTILLTRWTTRFFRWEKDPREDPTGFTALLMSPPLDTLGTDALAFDWPGAPTPKVPPDHFATLSETTLDLPAGTWRFRVTSDDGVRLLVDGKTVLEDWTWHAPKEATVEVPLSAGSHALRLEHFELDGYAALRCSIEPSAERR